MYSFLWVSVAAAKSANYIVMSWFCWGNSEMGGWINDEMDGYPVSIYGQIFGTTARFANPRWALLWTEKIYLHHFLHSSPKEMQLQFPEFLWWSWTRVKWNLAQSSLTYTPPQKKGNFRKVAFLLGKSVIDEEIIWKEDQYFCSVIKRC